MMPSRRSTGASGPGFADRSIADYVVREPFGGGGQVELPAAQGYLFEQRRVRGVTPHLLEEHPWGTDVASQAPVLDEPRHPHLVEPGVAGNERGDRKSTRLNSSHANISYAVFCLKKKITRS